MSATSSSVMPWTAVASGGIGTPGFTRRVRWSASPPGASFRTLTSMMRSHFGSMPVVSRSITARGRSRAMFLSMVPPGVGPLLRVSAPPRLGFQYSSPRPDERPHRDSIPIFGQDGDLGMRNDSRLRVDAVGRVRLGERCWFHDLRTPSMAEQQRSDRAAREGGAVPPAGRERRGLRHLRRRPGGASSVPGATGAERLLGYREDEILGRTADVFFTPEDVGDGVPQREMRQALADGPGRRRPLARPQGRHAASGPAA